MMLGSRRPMLNSQIIVTALVASMLAVLGGSAEVTAENWPQWRGPGGQGISRETKLPAAWSPEKNSGKPFLHPDSAGADRRHTYKVLAYDGRTGELLWEQTVVSPILYQGLVYLVNDRGVITAIDAKTGEVEYEGGRVPVPASFMGSPIAADGKIPMTSEDGETFVIKAGPKHEVLGTNSVGEPVNTTPAISNGRIYIRGEKHLFRIGN